MNNKPLVTTITPVLNRDKYLEECIESVLNQSYPYTEHILIDGGSTDGTLDILKEYSIKYPSRVWYISGKDRGACDAISKGMKIMKGSVYGFLGSDDTYPADAISKVVDAFRSRPDISVVYGNCNIVDGEGQFMHIAYAEDFELEEAIHTYCKIFSPALFYKTEVIDKVGYMDGSINVGDYDLILRAALAGFRFQRINEVLANFRMHPESVTCSSSAVYMYARENFKVARRYGAKVYGPRGRNLVVTYLIQPFRPILAPLYHNRLLFPLLSKLLHKIIGGKP